MRNFLEPKRKEAPAATTAAKGAPHVPQRTTYVSNAVDIPADFLKTTPFDARPVTASQIDWSKTVLPENGTRYALVLDHVLSPSECATLVRLAEASVPADPSNTPGSSGPSAPSASASPWKPALVNIGAGFEVLTPDYRNSDRIIWDTQEIADRLWARCVAGAPELVGARLGRIEGDEDVKRIAGPGSRRGGEHRWEFQRLNERMRFLRYGPGQFFRPHYDGPYGETGEDGKVLQTLFTLHLYLNDSMAEAEEGDAEADLVGGATSFLSSLDEKRKMDVDPKAGRVLIFQHRGLYHAGDDVLEGTKLTVRTDIIYELVYLEDSK